MRKVFMPSMDELYRMQDNGANIKLYLYAKAIESLCMDYNNYYNKDSVLRHEYKYLQEDEIISHAVCLMYPKEMEYSNIAKYDTELAELLLNKTNNDIYRLDNLSRFSNCTQGSPKIMYEVLTILSEELKSNPKYRFEYKYSNLLDNFFMCNIDIKEFCSNFNRIFETTIVEKLAQIEPYYAILNKELSDSDLLKKSVTDYINRYGFNYPYEDSKTDILTNQSTEVKRLFKCINKK